jgi:L-amino acid N-acyltransferase YncA
VIDEIRPLHAEHWAETEEYRWVVGMEVDYDQYVAAERQGQFALFTCRENGKMVGYVMMDIYRSRHTSRPQGTEDGLYLHPSARKGSRAVAFLRYVLSRLAAMGVRPVVLTSKVAHDIGALYRRLGGKRVAEVYVVGGDR